MSTDTLISLEDLDEQLQNEGLSFAELDGLIADSIKQTQESAEIKKARKMLAHGHLAPDERKALETVVRSWELRREWDAAAAVVIFDTQICSYCGCTHSHYLGLFQRQTSRKGHADRWIQSTVVANTGLPQEVKHQESYIPLCTGCMGEHGWKE